MNLEEGLVTYLLARTGLTALVSNRIYFEIVPQPDSGDEVYPAVTYQIISFPRVVSHQGASGLAYPRVQIGCWARTKIAVLPVRNAVIDALDGFTGLFGTVQVGACLKMDERDMSSVSYASPELRQARIYGRSIDFQIWHNEPKPTFA